MKRFYKMTKSEIANILRTLYHAQPKADWNTLVVGNVLMSKGRAWRITRIPPKRAFIMATNVLTGEVEKLLRSKYNNNDLLVTDEVTLALLRTNHKDEIEKAMAAGKSIGLKVQYDYPAIFTPYPASWDEKRCERRTICGNESTKCGLSTTAVKALAGNSARLTSGRIVPQRKSHSTKSTALRSKLGWASRSPK